MHRCHKCCSIKYSQNSSENLMSYFIFEFLFDYLLRYNNHWDTCHNIHFGKSVVPELAPRLRSSAQNYYKGIIYKLNQYIPKNILINLYYALIYPYLIYCNIAWASTCPTLLDPIIKVQKRSIRNICRAPFLAHTNDLFKDCKILKFADINKYCIAFYVFKNFNQFLTPDTHPHDTRNRHNLRVARHRLSLTQQNVSFMGPKVWNNLLSNLKTIPKPETFKNN